MRKFLPEALPIGILFILLIIFFFPILFLGQTFIGSGLIYSDLATLNYPLKVLLSQSLKEGSLPFWTSLIGNGTPIMAESQIGALYPFHLLLFRFLPTMIAFNLNLFLHFLLAALGTYFLCKVSFKLGWAASILAALSFIFSGFMLTRIHQTNIVLVVSFLPLIFLLMERIITQGKLFLVFLLSLVLALQILAGYIEMFYYSLLAGGLFTLLLILFQKERLRPILYLLLSLVLAVGLTAPQTLQTWEMTKYSVRSQGLTLESASTDTWPLKYFSIFLNPFAYDIYQPNPNYQPNDPTTVSVHDLYGYVGFLPFLLALFAIFTLFRKKNVLISLILLVFALVLSLGRSTQVFSIFWEIVPGLKFFRFPTKWLFLIDFSLAILAAFGLERILSYLSRLGNLSKKTVPVLIIFFVFADLYFNNRPLQPMTDTKFFEPPPVVETIKQGLNEGHFRLYSHGTNNIDYATVKDNALQHQFLNILPPDTNLLYGLPSNREWYTLFLARQHLLTRLNTTLDPQTGILRLPPQMKKSLNLQGVKYLLSDLPFEDEDLVLVKEFPLKKQIYHLAYLTLGDQMRTAKIPVEKTYVYENKAVLPRALWVERVRVQSKSKSDEEILGEVLADNFDPMKEVVLEQKSGIGNQESGIGNQGKAEIKNYQEQGVEIETQAESPGFLVLSDTWYPGWRATVDGHLTKIYRANFTFRAVEVPRGNHLVKFTYEPTYWRLGLGILMVTLLITLLGLGYSLWKRI